MSSPANRHLATKGSDASIEIPVLGVTLAKKHSGNKKPLSPGAVAGLIIAGFALAIVVFLVGAWILELAWNYGVTSAFVNTRGVSYWQSAAVLASASILGSYFFGRSLVSSFVGF